MASLKAQAKTTLPTVFGELQVESERLVEVFVERHVELVPVVFVEQHHPGDLGEEEIRGVAELAYEKGICLVSDEIYSKFTYDQPHVSAAKFNPDTIVIDGFSKSYAMTGLPLAWASRGTIPKSSWPGKSRTLHPA